MKTYYMTDSARRQELVLLKGNLMLVEAKQI